MNELASRITESARARIAAYLACREPGSVLALMYGSSKTYGPDGKLKTDTPLRWQLQAYPKAQAEALERQVAASGAPFFHVASGITFCVPQFHLIEQLQGRTLDVEGDDICLK
jgi:hypothetical protein